MNGAGIEQWSLNRVSFIEAGISNLAIILSVESASDLLWDPRTKDGQGLSKTGNSWNSTNKNIMNSLRGL